MTKVEEELVRLGQECELWITGDPTIGMETDTPEKALKVLEIIFSILQELNDIMKNSKR